MKRFHPHIGRDEDIPARLRAEVALLSRLHHPNVVRPVEIRATTEGYLLVLEEVHGGTLDSILVQSSRRGIPLPLPIALRIALDALAGLRTVHDLVDDDGRPAGLVHRDISSDTIWVDADGVARLGDVGVSRGMGYLAIDHLRSTQLERRADLFALASVMAECLEAVDGTIPSPIAAVCARALDRDVARRHASAAEMAEELERAAAEVGVLATHREVAGHVDLVAAATPVRHGRRREFAVGSDMPPPAHGTAALDRAVPPPPPPRRAADVPERFGKYAVTRHIATGGMAEVYLATASGIEGFEKTVVIKRLKPSLAATTWATEMFLQEARIAATLEHPQIAQVHDVGEIDGSYFFAMEHVHGQDLRRILRAARDQDRRIPLEHALRIVADVCSALHYAHEKCGPDGHPLGLVHRDVSPSNILVSYDGAVKLCDFGIAEINAARRDPGKRVRAGKLSYMSPEQCRGEPLDRRSDVFVLAIVLYELTVGAKVFEGKSERDVARQVVAGRVRAPSSVRADYPAELERIVLRGLRVDPAARYPTAQDMLLEVEAFGRERRLAMSALGLAHLMDELFPAADREAEPPLLEAASGFDSSALVHARPRRRWLRGALIAAGVALAAAAAVRWPSRGGGGVAVEAPPSADARVARLVAARIEQLRARADGIAGTPMLRAAITTDARTLADMATHEELLAARPGEVIELFRRDPSGATSLVRVPAGAPPTRPLAGGEVAVIVQPSGLLLIASARVDPLYPEPGVVGALVIASHIDLDDLKETP